jgi:hypothetical protein
MSTIQPSIGPNAPIAVLPIKPPGENASGEPIDGTDVQEWIRREAEKIMAAARLRWPRFGPWRLVITCREDGHCEWMLRGRSWKSPDIADRARCGATMEDLQRRVLHDTDE